jgi:hypothetical protein
MTYLGSSDDDITIRRAKVLARIDADKKTLANLDQKVRDEAAFQAKWGITITRVEAPKDQRKIWRPRFRPSGGPQ